MEAEEAEADPLLPPRAGEVEEAGPVVPRRQALVEVAGGLG